MQSGLINKVALTPANITDAKGLKHVLPSSGAIYADKGYCDKQRWLVGTKSSRLMISV
jgi:IS5 family transposase